MTLPAQRSAGRAERWRPFGESRNVGGGRQAARELEAVAKLREALRGELGEQAVRALGQPRDRRSARQSRCAAR
jgi:hypothetical protein